MELWSPLLNILILLLGALLLGAICERFNQSALLGYLVAGTLLGPNALNWMPDPDAVHHIAELGVALLLFSIGLEFSLPRMKRIGAMALGGGSLQIILTAVPVALIAMALGLGPGSATALGAMLALSSTACVLQMLVRYTAMDSVHGRNALGILLFQDAAVVPLVILVTVLGGSGTPAQLVIQIARAILGALGLIGVLWITLNYVVPPFLGSRAMRRNRELPILLAILVALGAAWASRRLGMSPALGAFVAGMALAGSPFSVQIRADVGALRTVFVTLFFSSIGMLGDPLWAAQNFLLILAFCAAIVIGKTLIVGFIARLLGTQMGDALATGICLAQVGEFSFVLAEVARTGGVLDEDLFRLVVSATIVTLFLTPYLIKIAPKIAQRFNATGPLGATAALQSQSASTIAIIIGFGPSGRKVAEEVRRTCGWVEPTVIELNPRTAAQARDANFRTVVGDASQAEVLQHARVESAATVVVTLPDPTVVLRVIQQVRACAPHVPIIARARYHMFADELVQAGASLVVDEEEEIGLAAARQVQSQLARGDADIVRP